MFATLWRASQRWQGVKVSGFERQQPRLLRREPGLPPDGTQGALEPKTQRLTAWFMPPFVQGILGLTLLRRLASEQRLFSYDLRVGPIQPWSVDYRTMKRILVESVQHRSG